MNPVLLATDGSPTAAKATDTAIELARLLDSELVVVCVWDVAYAATGLAPMPLNGEFAKMEEQEARERSPRRRPRAQKRRDWRLAPSSCAGSRSKRSVLRRRRTNRASSSSARTAGEQ
jgi:hypothetical protein